MSRAVLLLALVASACDTTGTDAGLEGALLQTDAPAYDAAVVARQPGQLGRVEAEVPYAVRNTTDGPLYLTGCRPPNPPALEKLEGGEWAAVYVPVVLDCLSPAVEVAPGGVLRDTLRLFAAFPGQNTVPTFDTDVPGTYRLRQALYARVEDDGLGRDLLDAERSVSNPFELR